MPLKILCDENIPAKVCKYLKEAGHDVKLVKNGQPDKEIASQASREGRIILTFDSDFANILAYPPDQYPGIIFLKFEPPVIDLILKSLRHITVHFACPEDYKGKLIVGEPGRFRVWE